MSNQLTTEPAALYSGDTINWLISLSDYPASGGWTLKYNAVSASGRFALVSTASGDDHLISANSAATAAYPAAVYSLIKYVEHTDGTRITLAESEITIKPNLADKTAAFDNRSHAKKMLDTLTAFIEGRANPDQLRVTINGVSIDKMTAKELFETRALYEEKYRQEQQKSNKILVRFV